MMAVDWRKWHRRIGELLRLFAAQLQSQGRAFYEARILPIWRYIEERLHSLVRWLWNRIRAFYEGGLFWLLLALVLLFWLFDWKVSWLFATAVPLVYLFLCGYTRNRGIGVAEAFILLLCYVLVGIGPRRVEEELRSWTHLAEDRVKKGTGIKVQTPFFSFTVEGDPRHPKEVKIQRLIPTTAVDMSTELERLLAKRQPMNVIRNGDFLIPLDSTFSPWGHGQYTDQLRARTRRWDILWINFLNADIDVQIAPTEIGPALRIEKRTGITSDQVGIIEQYIWSEPGAYRISLSAKGEGVEPCALWCRTTGVGDMTTRAMCEWMAAGRRSRLCLKGAAFFT